MAIREYTVQTNDTQKLESILKSFSEVKIIVDEENRTREQSQEDTDGEKELKKRRYEKLAGKAVELEDDIEELLSISRREEAWREEEN